MHHKRLILAGAGGFLLVFGSISYGADPASTSPASSPQQIYLIRENPFFNLHIEKAVKHAREAEIAGNMGESEVLLEHARLSLMQAREAQRAGNVPGLNEGIANLKKAVSLPTWLPQASTQTTRAEAPQASMQPSSTEVPQATPVTGEKALSGTQRADAAVRSATDLVREARKNLSEAGGLKYKEIQPQTVKTVAQ
jgi:Small metal-binding protein